MREILITAILTAATILFTVAAWYLVRAKERNKQTDARNAECDRAIREQLDVTIARGRLHG